VPIKKAAKKWLRKSEKRRKINLAIKKKLKELIKQTRNFIVEKKFNEAQRSLTLVYKALDKAAKRKVIKKNTASRKKSRLALALNKAMAKKTK